MINLNCSASVPAVNVLEDCAPEVVAYVAAFLASSVEWVEDVPGLSWTRKTLSIAVPSPDMIATRGSWTKAAAVLTSIKDYQQKGLSADIAARLSDGGTVF